jgi:3-phosphoshikimate 1-carboxyvinyltransferase
MSEAFRQITVIGLGLIGGSVAAGARQRALTESVVAWDADPASLKKGLELGVIDRAAETIAEAVSGADLVVIAVPVAAMTGVFSQLPDTTQLMTDVGSVKTHVIDQARSVFGELPENFVPGHPIAGSEQHGVTATNPDLFEQHRVILTPAENTAATAEKAVADFWTDLGAEVVTMSAAHHDSVLAQTSHLPHLLAYALVDTLSSGGDSLEVFEHAAGGFRDFSRIAASDPVMWRDIFATNTGPVLEVLDRYMADLVQLRTLIESGNGADLEAVFKRAKMARDHFSELDQARKNGKNGKGGHAK